MTMKLFAVEFSELDPARRVTAIGTLNGVGSGAKKTILIISDQQAVNAENTGVTRIAPSN